MFLAPTGFESSRVGLLLAAVLLMAACETVESGGSQTLSTGTGTLSHSGIQDEVTINGGVTVSGSSGN